MATRWLNKEKVLKRFRKLPDVVKQNIRADFASGAEDMVQTMKRRAPKDDGDLAESIKWRWDKPARGIAPGGLTVRVSAGNGRVRYAHLVEHGAAPHIAGGKFKGAQHPGMAAQPFFYPSYRQKRKPFKNRQRRAFKKAIAASKGA